MQGIAEKLPQPRNDHNIDLSSMNLLDVEAISERKHGEDHYTRYLASVGRLSEIAQPLSALVGRVEEIAVPIPKELHDGFIPCNPSVCVHEFRRLAIVRGVNYRQPIQGGTVFPFARGRCLTRNWWCEFDQRWNLISAKIIEDPYPERPGAVQGYEDCRLFHADGKFWASCNFAERPQLIGNGAFGLLCEMTLIQLSDDGNIEKVSALRGPWSVQIKRTGCRLRQKINPCVGFMASIP